MLLKPVSFLKKAAAGADPVPTYLSTNVIEAGGTSHTHTAMSTSGHSAGDAVVVIIYNAAFAQGPRPSAVSIDSNSLTESTGARAVADVSGQRPTVTIWYGTGLTLGSTSDVAVTFTAGVERSTAVVYTVSDFTSIAGYAFVDTANSQTVTFTVSVADGDCAILGAAALADGRTYDTYATVAEDVEGDYFTSNSRPYTAASASGLTTNASLTISASLNSAFDRNNGSLVVIS